MQVPRATTKLKQKQNVYNSYSDRAREVPVDRMLESAEERGRIVRFANELGVEIRTAWRWQETLSGNR
ncbi:hypothetical protein [Parasitella parasitica]|uniref:Uncharacterized protein n=1 Tax=Parasitella parasitica TaxID=35722 RepID=A0A0B7ND51_9FUNG|nr:hypothetical protein [Parasitella parasitica]